MRRLLMMSIFLTVLILSSVAYASPVDSTKAWLVKLKSSKPDTNRIKLLLKFGHNILYKPDLTKKQLDSTFQFFNEGLALAVKLKLPLWQNQASISLVQYWLDKKDTVTAKEKFSVIIADFMKSEDYLQESKAWIRMAEMLETNSPPNTATIDYLKRGADQCEKHHNILAEANILKGIGLLYYHKNNLKMAIPRFEEAVSRYKSCGEIMERRHYQALLAGYYWNIGNIQQSLFYSIEAYNTSGLSHDPRIIFTGNQDLGIRYFYLEKYDHALEYLEHSFYMAKQLKNSFYYYIELYNVVYCRMKLKQSPELLKFIKKAEKELPPADDVDSVSLNAAYGIAYDATNNYSSAEHHFLKMYATFELLNKNQQYKTLGDAYFRSYNLLLGNFYVHRHKYEQGRPFFDRILQLPPDQATPWTLSEVHLGLFKIDSASGNYVAAINHFEQNRLLHDSIFNIQATAKVAELNIKYETSQRLKDIKLLKSERDGQLVTQQKIRLQRNITFGATAAVLIITGLVFRSSWRKQRNNKQLEIKQTEINRQNISLQALLAEKDAFLIKQNTLLHEKEGLLTEKDWLIKEVHHRVKNNLQVVMSLLRTQSMFIDNKVAVQAISESLYRVNAIALLHQKLYGGVDLTAIDMPSYVMDLVNYLSDGFSAEKKAIRFKKNIKNISIDLAQAVPVGLILNEAITNAIKYAFQEEGGLISISLGETNDQIARLEITDDGKGFKADLSGKEHKTFGIKMMEGLSRQLKGTFAIKSEPGVSVKVAFKLKRAPKNDHHSDYISFDEV